MTEVGVGQIKFQFDHLKKDQEKTLETEGMLKSKAWKKLSEATNVTAKNLKKGMNIPKFGKVDNVSKQGHIVIVYSGKTKKKYDENESVGIDESIGMVIGTPLTRRGEATPTSHVDEQTWSKDPFKFKRDLALRIVKVSDWVGEQVHTSDRYYPGVDHSPKEKAYVDKVLKLMDDAASKLETAMLKARKVKMF